MTGFSKGGARLGKSRRSSAIVAFSPASLGASVRYYDPNDIASIWQDSAKTIAGAINSPVGNIDDKGINLSHLFQATAGNRPTLRQVGGKNHLEFDGVSDMLKTAPFALNQPFNRFSAVSDVWVNNTVVLDGDAGTSTALYCGGGGGSHYLVAGTFNVFSPGPGDNVFVVWTERYTGVTSKLAYNLTAYQTGDAGVNNSGGLTLGANGAGIAPANCKIGRVIVIDRDLTNAEIANCRQWIADGSNIVL